MVSWAESSVCRVEYSLVFLAVSLASALHRMRTMRAMIRGFSSSAGPASGSRPRAASAVTVDQVVALAKAGVTDAVILALIDRDRTVFAIEPEQIVTLQREGLSEAVILAMLKSGRDEGDEAARADSAYNAATIAAAIATGPRTLIVGHGPERPNTAHPDGFYSGPPASVPVCSRPYPSSVSRIASLSAPGRVMPRRTRGRSRAVARATAVRSCFAPAVTTRCVEREPVDFADVRHGMSCRCCSRGDRLR